MRPAAARVVMILTVSAIALSAITLVNTRYHGSFLVGLLAIVVPVLVLSFALPHVLPVRCALCHTRMRFRSTLVDEHRRMFAYVCDHCQNRHEWEGASSGSTLDS